MAGRLVIVVAAAREHLARQRGERREARETVWLFGLHAVRDALMRLGISGITATQVQGFGRQRGQTEFYRGNEYQATEVPKLKLEIAVPSGQSEAVIEAIQKTAGSGKIGDGKIFVSGLSEVVRIRTGERDEKALD